MPLLSDAVFLGGSIVLFTPNGKFFNCATIAFSERHNLARELEDMVMKNEQAVGSAWKQNCYEFPVLSPTALTPQMRKMASHILEFIC